MTGFRYRARAEKLTFNPAGGRGEFNVITIPGDCQWKITDTFSDITIVGPRNGAGAATVVYNVSPNAFQFDHFLRVQGLSGLNPPATHIAHVRN